MSVTLMASLRVGQSAKAWLATVLLCLPLSAASAATGHKAAAAPVVRTECALAVGLCVTVPAAWQRLGDVFENFGFVAAEPHPGVDSALWPQLTVAAIDMPAQSGGTAAPPSLDSLVDLVLTPEGSSTAPQTLQRTRLLLNDAPAEIVRVQLHDEAGKPEAMEAVALIDGGEGFVYSIALRCAPEDFARLEPVFQQTASSWSIQAAVAPASTAPLSTAPSTAAPPSAPKQSSAKP
jgi:hypothetical protein